MWVTPPADCRSLDPSCPSLLPLGLLAPLRALRRSTSRPIPRPAPTHCAISHFIFCCSSNLFCLRCIFPFVQNRPTAPQISCRLHSLHPRPHHAEHVCCLMQSCKSPSSVSPPSRLLPLSPLSPPPSLSSLFPPIFLRRMSPMLGVLDVLSCCCSLGISPFSEDVSCCVLPSALGTRLPPFGLVCQSPLPRDSAPSVPQTTSATRGRLVRKTSTAACAIKRTRICKLLSAGSLASSSASTSASAA